MVSDRVMGMRSGCGCEICDCGWVSPPLLSILVVMFFFFGVGTDIGCNVCLRKEILELGFGFV